MLCPTPDTGPDKIFYNRTENYGEIIFFGTPNSTENLVADANLWKVEVKAMSDADWTSTIKSYKRGPWDPAFQIIWRETTRFGCSLVKYNNTDLAELSRIFKKQVTQPMTLNTLVCHFSPAGCIEGEKPFVCTEIPSVGPLPPYIPSVNPFPPQSSVRPFSSARRLGVDMGFNFGNLFVLYMLFEHLVLSL
uniref:Pathogenesis-related protein PRB1-3 n=1 Tax=Lygus hesperus TaxID=30085 RepID=A0A0A9XHT5_LYGHE